MGRHHRKWFLDEDIAVNRRVQDMMDDLEEYECENRLLRWELKMRNDGYVAPFPEEEMRKKIKKDIKLAGYNGERLKRPRQK